MTKMKKYYNLDNELIDKAQSIIINGQKKIENIHPE